MLRNLFWHAMNDTPINPCLSTSSQALLSTGDCNLKTDTVLITNPLNHVNFQKKSTLINIITKTYCLTATRANHFKLRKQTFHSFSGTPQSLFQAATRQIYWFIYKGGNILLFAIEKVHIKHQTDRLKWFLIMNWKNRKPLTKLT